MFRTETGTFDVVSLDDSEFDNPWKMSLIQMYRGIHVREGYKDMYVDSVSGRNIICVDSIGAALSLGGDNPLIFIHTNKYVGDSLVIDNNAQILGAGNYIALLINCTTDLSC